MSFRTSHYILRESAGAYVNCEWVGGTRSALTVNASVQPAKMSDLKAQPEGRLQQVHIKIYTDAELKESDGEAGQQPDFIMYRGFAYEIVGKSEYQSGVISHFKYIARRDFKITNPADWTNGTIERN